VSSTKQPGIHKAIIFASVSLAAGADNPAIFSLNRPAEFPRLILEHNPFQPYRIAWIVGGQPKLADDLFWIDIHLALNAFVGLNNPGGPCSSQPS